MNEKSNTFLETEPVGSLMRSYAIPCIISLLVASLYNIVDQIFIANATYLGSYGNAANTVVFPLTVVALALAVMIGDGCCAFVGISLGSGAHDDAHRSIGCSVILCIIVSLVVTAAYLVFDDPILTMFGGRVNDETFTLSKEYFFWITLGIPFYMFGQAMNPIIRSDGSPRFAMAATVSGAVVNIILDPLFIFGFSWGMMGAAVATVLGQVLTAGLSVWYLCRMKAARLQRCSFVLSGGMHTHRRLQYRRGPQRQGKEALQAPAALRGCRRRCGARRGRVLPAGADCDFRCSQRERVLHPLRPAGLPHLPVHNHPRLREQGNLHLPPVPGQGAPVHASVDGARGAVRRRLALLLPVFFGLDGILLSMPVSDVLTFFFSVAVIVYTNKVLSKAQ